LIATNAARKRFIPLTLVVALLGCVAVAELISRLVLVLQYGSPASEYAEFGYYREPLQGFELFPDLRDARFERLQTTISTSSRSLRGKTEYGPKRPGEIRGAVIGGSCVFGFGASSDDTTISGQLSGHYRNLEVMNAGVPGYISYQVLAKLQLKLIDLEPDFVVVYMGWNDFFFAALDPPYRRNHFFARDRYFSFDSWQTFIEERNASLRPALLRPLAASMFVGRAIGALRSLAEDDTGKDPITDDDGYLVHPESVREAVKGQLRDNLLSMVGLLEARDVKVIIVSLFSETDVYTKDRAEINEVLHSLALETGSEWIDADRVVRDRGLTGVNQPTDHYHLTDEGNALVASLVAERLSRLIPTLEPQQAD
jgi:lysophospholipase L1-like esterase